MQPPEATAGADLSKVALEEHYLDPETVRRVLGDSAELARISAGGGVMPGYYGPIMHRLADFGDDRPRRWMPTASSVRSCR